MYDCIKFSQFWKIDKKNGLETVSENPLSCVILFSWKRFLRKLKMCIRKMSIFPENQKKIKSDQNLCKLFQKSLMLGDKKKDLWKLLKTDIQSRKSGHSNQSFL